MLRTYVKTAFRNFKRHKGNSLINLIGLSLGITCALYIFVYVSHEFSYEDFFHDANRIYRIEQQSSKDNVRYAITPNNINPEQLDAISGIKAETRLAYFANVPVFVRANNKKIVVENIYVADSTFFSIFNFHFIAGNPKTALSQSNSIVLSEKTAKKFFGSQNAIGQTVSRSVGQKEWTATVGGVIKVPTNTHLQLNAIVSKDALQKFGGTLSQSYLGYDYVALKRGQKPAAIAKQIKKVNKNRHTQFINYHLQPITRIHLYSHVRYELGPNSNIRYIYFLIAISFILLIVAGINFASLATAQNLQRFKEAGIRKVLGAQKGQLMGQFLVEVIGITLLALFISYLVVYFTLPFFNNFAGEGFHFSLFLTPITLIIFIGGTILLGMLAGLYPALLFSAFQPVKTLNGVSPSGHKGATIWKSIVVIQFAVSIAMIISTLTIFRQLQYVERKNLGFDKNHIITFANYTGTDYKTFKSRLKTINSVKDVTTSTYIPGTSQASGTAFVSVGGRPDSLTFNWISTDPNFLTTYDIKLEKGRFFSEKFATDTSEAVVLNEAAVKALGLKSPLGKRIDISSLVGITNGKIIGVTSNFNFLSLYQKMPPMLFIMNKDIYFNFSVKLAANSNPPEVIREIKDIWQRVLPNMPFEYQFVDQQFDALYKTDRQMGRVFGIFAILALFISCLGLFSLSSFMAARKKKEIGIRKVMGASISNILFSFYRRYGLLVGIACLIAIPTSYIFLSRWLQNFAYGIGMPAWVFLIAVLATLFIALSAVSFESVKASLADPVDSLRNE